ncbi:MAG: UDP-N-acetylmuramate--L-alanine ligase [Candidatus Vogelbacteria bacterium]
MTNLSSRQKVYFIGIGGIGVSALARKYLSDGYQVLGSDRTTSLITTELEKLGVKIFLKQRAGNITADFDLVIYTIAIPANHPELVRARKLGIKVLSYPEALGKLSRKVFTIAIAGTHGKTTTTAMVAEILLTARRDPMVIVGSLLRRAGARQSNFIAGKGPLVVEACEYRRSFLNLSPQILVITNIDNDHLDYYRDLADIQSAFAELASKVPKDGKVITEKEYLQIKLPIKLLVPGQHNQRNAQAAIAVAKTVGISERLARRALASFRGTWRRFEYKGKTKRGALIYDDYAHHPTEIRATLAAAREEFPRRRIIVIFQPHLYSRTKLLFKEFTESFADADEILILPIYAAREPKDKTISSRILATAIPRATYVPNFLAVEKHLAKTDRHDLILNLGAGDVSLNHAFLNLRQRK